MGEKKDRGGGGRGMVVRTGEIIGGGDGGRRSP